MPTVDTAATAVVNPAQRPTGLAATALSGMDALFADMMAAFTASLEASAEASALRKSAPTGTDPLAAASSSEEKTAQDATAATDLAAALALMAQGAGVDLSGNGALRSPAGLGAERSTVSATSSASAGLDPTATGTATTAPVAVDLRASTAAATAAAAAALAVRTALAETDTTPASIPAPSAPRLTPDGLAVVDPNRTSAAPADSTAAASTPAATPAPTTVDAATAALAADAAARMDAAAERRSTAARTAAADQDAADTTTKATATAAATETTDASGLTSFVARRIAPDHRSTEIGRVVHAAPAVASTAPTEPAPDASTTAPAATTAPARTRPAEPEQPDLADLAPRPRLTSDDERSRAAVVDTSVAIAEADDRLGDAPLDVARADVVAPPSHRATAEAITTAPTTTSTAGVAAVPLAAVAETIAARASSGTSRFTVKLDPAELGAVDVRVEVRANGEVRAHLVVERSDTLDMMLRDQKNLERSLGQAGLDVSSSGLQFSLRDQNARRDDQRGWDDGSAEDRERVEEIAPRATPELAIAAYGTRRIGGVDLRI